MPSDDSDFKKFHFKSPDRVDRKWLEWFREEYGRRVYGVDMEPDPDVPLSLEGTSRLLPGLSAYEAVAHPCAAGSRRMSRQTTSSR